MFQNFAQPNRQLNKSFLAIGYRQTDRITDICDSRVAFATESQIMKLNKEVMNRTTQPLMMGTMTKQRF